MQKTIPLSQFIQNMQNLSSSLEDTEPLMAHIANALQNSTSEAFERETSPFGEKWQDLSPSTLKKHKGLKKKLVDKGKLVNSIHTTYDSQSAKIGSNVVYARIHQFGGKTGRNHKAIIPARPFLPINTKGEIPEDLHDEINDLVLEYVLQSLKTQD